MATAFGVLMSAAVGCPGGGGGGGCSGDGPGDETIGTTVASTSSPTPTTDVDETIGDTGTLGSCSDDYDGNHSLLSAHALGLSTTDTARAFLGDHVLTGPGNEQGSDRLVVCPGSPDFFTVEPACPGYMGIELRRLDGGELDLHLHADGIEVDQAVGAWNDFFLKPLHLPVSPQTYTVEVRHAGGGAQPYSLGVYVLPTAPCP